MREYYARLIRLFHGAENLAAAVAFGVVAHLIAILIVEAMLH
ncbi:hypothetical protein [Nocardiopsis sp. CNT-189]